MAILATNADPRHCRCGALCESTKSRCRKCLYRARWYRRKAWRCNPLRALYPDSHGRSDLT